MTAQRKTRRRRSFTDLASLGKFGQPGQTSLLEVSIKPRSVNVGCEQELGTLRQRVHDASYQRMCATSFYSLLLAEPWLKLESCRLLLTERILKFDHLPQGCL